MVMYSHSRLSTFENCPLQFKLKYLDKQEPLFKNTVEAFMGSRVHDTLEKLYNMIKYAKVMEKADVISFYHEDWDKKWTDDIKVVKEDFTVDDYRKLGERCVSDYYDRFHPFDQDRLIACEQRIIVTFGQDDKYQLQGYIDRLSCDDKGTYYIHDYKTSMTLPQQEKVDKDRQLALYSIAVKENYADCKDIKLVWHYLGFDKDVVSVRSDEDLEQLKQEIGILIDKIEGTKEFPAKVSALCGWCGYHHLCPHFKHLHKLESTVDNEHIDDDGYSLVNKYAEAKEREAQIKQEIDKLTVAIYAAAERENAAVLFGDHKKLRIWQKDCVKLPGKKDPLAPELRKLLESLQRYDEISIIDTWELAKIIEGSKWPQEILDMLKGFYRKEHIKRIYMGDR